MIYYDPMNRYPYFKPANYSEFLEDVKRHLRRDEPGVIISYPGSGIAWRAEQLVQDFSHVFNGQIKLISLSETSEIEDIIKTLSTYRYVIITNTEFAFENGATDQINEMIAYQRKRHGDLHILFLSEKNIFEPHYKKRISQSTFFANVSYYPLYSKEISKDFLRHMLKRWEVTMPSHEQHMIIESCGGSIWLIKHALRLKKNYPHMSIEDILSDQTMIFRVESIWHSFTPDEQEALKHIVQGSFTRISPLHRQYFQNTRIIQNKKISIPLLEQFIIKNAFNLVVTVKDDHISINNVQVTEIFSEQERDVFVLLHNYVGRPVDREQIAEVLWNEDIDEKYSPWAIEQLMRRLRKKLINLGLPKKSIMTVRGKGYMFGEK